jgi:ribonuclease-3
MQSDIVTAAIGYQFNQKSLLCQALTHRSHSALHNERLEFLGDSVLNCVIAAKLFSLFPERAEGDLSRLRANLVNQNRLCEIARELKLGSQLFLGEGELKSGGAERPSILADALEALIGAVYVDGGFDNASGVVLRLFGKWLNAADLGTIVKDSKTQLQELLQSRKIALPRYAVIEVGGDAHERTFRVECEIPELQIRTQGEGTSRRSAEQSAASRAYELGLLR